MKKSFFRSGAALLAVGLSCSFLLAGCEGLPGQRNESMKSNLSYQTSGTQSALPAAGMQTGAAEPDLVSSEWYIRTDSQMYCNAVYNKDEAWSASGRTDSQQTIYISASGGSGAWVGIFKAEDTAFKSPVKGYALSEAEGYRYALPAKDLQEGDYVAGVFPAEGTSVPRAVAAFSVTDGAVMTNKAQYYQDEQIVFSFYADTTNTSGEGGSYRWLGLYKKQESGTYGRNFLKWVTLCGNQLISGQGYYLQDNKIGETGWSAVYPAHFETVEPIWEPGTYELVLFGDSGYGKVLDKAEFTVVSGSVGEAYAPESVMMNVFGAEDGVLSGEVLCSFAPSRFNASEIVAYWANEDGVLEGYLPFAAQRVTGNPQRYYAFENIMIPEGATHLRFYGKNAAGLGETYFRVDLPEGSTAMQKGTPVAEFAYLSDIHVGYKYSKKIGEELQKTEVTSNSNNFRIALDDVKNILGADGDVFIVGDVTESGRSEEWELVESIVQEKSLTNSVYYMLGNHDYYGVYQRQNSGEDIWQQGDTFENAVKPFTDWVSTKASSGGTVTASGNNLWYEAVTDGVHHLVLNTEGSDGDWVCAHLSLAQINWLQTRLAALAQEDPTAPVFVYLHQPLTDTTAGTMPGEGWDHVKIYDENNNLVRSAEPLKEILNNYPNAFFVSGHNHRELDDYRTVFAASTAQKNNFIQTGGTAYISKGITPGVNLRHEGWYVRVYEDKVVLLGREFTTGQWLSGACYVFDLK